VDVGLDVARSFYEQSFGEPRWRPSPIVVKMVAAGATGRKSGRGYYDYSRDPYRSPDPEPRTAGGGNGLVVVAGDSPVALSLVRAAGEAGWRVQTPGESEDTPFLTIDCTAGEELDAPLQGGPTMILCAAGSLAALDPGGNAVGFHLLPPLGQSGLVELTRGPDSADSAASAAERFFTTLGKHTAWVGDAPGLVLGRMICAVVNEAAFALGEGVGSAEDIDAGMIYGLNYPRGPLAWADEIGLDLVYAVVEGLREELGGERYRPAPELRRRVLSGRLGRQTGEGFFTYE
jgi:3-hydroxybutyryl-CoA dehydrogenase